MKLMEFKHKDIYVKVHCPLIVTKYDSNLKRRFLVYATIIDIDSRVQAVFAQFHHAKKVDEIFFRIGHAPRIGEKDYDKSFFYAYPQGKYKHRSQREDETFVTGLIASESVLERQENSYIIMAWDGNIHEKLFWAIDAYYETPVLEEWIPYLFNRLLVDNHIIPLDVQDFTGDYSELVAFELLVGEDILDECISFGLRRGEIQLIEDAKEAV